MKAYIKGISAISAQESFNKNLYIENSWIENSSTRLKAIEPDYSKYISSGMSRRMSRIIKMSMAASRSAMDQAGITMPGAVIVGTGLGCTSDTEKFLKEIIKTDEGILSPTAFIQSTHNTIAGQIALSLKCLQHNFTWSNRGHSFENALTDAQLLLEEGSDNVLCGAVDELSDTVLNIANEIAKEANSKSKYHFGEGATFFVLSKSAENSLACINDISTFCTPSTEEVKINIRQFLINNHLKAADIDTLILGGDINDAYYKSAFGEFNTETTTALNFKKISGEYFTASAYAIDLATGIFQSQAIPANAKISKSSNNEIKNVLIYNHCMRHNHSLFLLSK